MPMNKRWNKGGKYFETWEGYTVAANGMGFDEQGKKLWQFTAYCGTNEYLGAFCMASQARKRCKEHHDKITNTNTNGI